MRVCLTPKVGSGGPASFQGRLEAEFRRLEIDTTFDPNSRPLDAVLVFAGTRNLISLMRCRREKIRVVQRLDAINWLHRVTSRPLKHFLRAEANNLLMRIIRSTLADRIVYQSQFALHWWEDWYGRPRAETRVIYNGIPMGDYPARKGPHDGTLLVIEGSLPYDGYLRSLLHATHQSLVQNGPLRRMQIFGSLDPGWDREWDRFEPKPAVEGRKPYAEVQARQAQAALYLSMDINAACPNAVVEALASGLPVIGYDTGSLRELVGQGGEVVPLEGNPWRLEIPRNLEALGEAGRRVLAGWEDYSRRSRKEAETRLDIREAAKLYRDVLAG